jgi:hypothetical protein
MVLDLVGAGIGAGFVLVAAGAQDRIIGFLLKFIGSHIGSAFGSAFRIAK